MFDVVDKINQALCFFALSPGTLFLIFYIEIAQRFI